MNRGDAGPAGRAAPRETAVVQDADRSAPEILRELRGLRERLVESESALRESERRVSIALQATNAAAWSYDAVNNGISLSRNWYDMAGLPVEAGLTSPAQWESRVLADDRAGVSAEMARLARGDSYEFRTELRVRVRSGKWRWFLAHGRSVAWDESGRPTRVTGILIDIDDRRRAEQEVRRAKEAAVDANNAKSRFLANMSHEIRTPMSGVIGMAELLLDTPLNPKQRDYVETLEQSGTALLTILDDVLDLSKIEAGKFTLESVRFDLRTVVEQTGRLLSPRAREKGIDLLVRYSPEAPSRLIGDPLRVRQVLMNLVSNAVKFTDRGRVLIDVACERRDEGRATIRLRVSDTGIGIPRQRQQDIFEAFEQADASTTRRIGGTGLGLPISRRLVEMMGGELAVTSEPGRGAAFHFRVTFPLDDRTDDPLDGPAEAEVDGTEFAGVRVLLVEDNLANRKVGRAVLENFGCRVETAADGMQAVESARRHEYDIIFMDCSMPVLDGYEATARIRELPDARGRTPIVAMTAHASSDDRGRCLQAGMDDHLPKPVRKDAVRRVLCGYCRRGHAETTPSPAPPQSESPGPASNAAILDVEYLPTTLSGQMDAVEAVVDAFLEDVPKTLGQLADAMARQDLSAIERRAHAIGGSSVNVGGNRLGELAYQIERSALDGSVADCAAVLPRLQEGLAHLTRALQQADWSRSTHGTPVSAGSAEDAT